MTIFRKPPLNELVIGVYFQPPIHAFRSEHIGMLWSKLREDFPVVKQRQPLRTSDTTTSLNPTSGEYSIMPRYWFVSDTKSTLVQIQKNAFILNWRRGDSPYPHFAQNLKPYFDRLYGTFETFLQDDVRVNVPSVSLCELTYVNVIEPCDWWRGPQDTSQVINSFVIPNCESTQDVASAFNCMYIYDIGFRSQLRIAIRTIERAAQRGSPSLVFELKALGYVGDDDKPNIDAWYSRAHDTIVDRFLNMTNKHVQRMHWMPQEKTE